MKYTLNRICTIGFQFKYGGTEYTVIPVVEEWRGKYINDINAKTKVWVRVTGDDDRDGGYFPTEALLWELNNKTNDLYETITPATPPLQVKEDLFTL